MCCSHEINGKFELFRWFRDPFIYRCCFFFPRWKPFSGAHKVKIMYTNIFLIRKFKPISKAISFLHRNTSVHLLFLVDRFFSFMMNVKRLLCNHTETIWTELVNGEETWCALEMKRQIYWWTVKITWTHSTISHAQCLSTIEQTRNIHTRFSGNSHTVRQTDKKKTMKDHEKTDRYFIL